jgi:hypothetical protein
MRKRALPRCRKLTEHQTILRHIIIKTLSTQNKETILKAEKEKIKVTKKANPLENSRFLNSNSKHKKVMEGHNPGPERKQLSTQSSLLGKTILLD